MNAALTSLLMVTLAEMGDKTQLLAMAFATRYKPFKVLLGVLIATLLNHALAVALGALLAGYEMIQNWIQLVAGLSFLFFGLWSIRGDTLEGEDKKKTRFGPVMTVAIAFFIAELGDKTQLATISLAAKYPQSPLFILMGTTGGMLIADGIGVFAGCALCKWVPERVIKLVSAGAFVVFGLVGVWQSLTENFAMAWPAVAAIDGALAVACVLIGWWLLKRAPKDGAMCACPAPTGEAAEQSDEERH